jgi:hypothetical protein
MVDESKEKALSAALSQIERQFGKGSMMRLGDSERESYPLDFYWLAGARCCAGYRRPCRAGVSWRFMALSPRVKPP